MLSDCSPSHRVCASAAVAEAARRIVSVRIMMRNLLIRIEATTCDDLLRDWLIRLDATLVLTPVFAGSNGSRGRVARRPAGAESAARSDERIQASSSVAALSRGAGAAGRD